MNTEEDIFEAAAALPAAERSAYLEVACAGQPELRVRLEALLRSHDVTAFMEAGETATRLIHPAEERLPFHREQSGGHIGRYRLLEQIGEGGFGEVWMAEQLEPVTRRVALKIIKAGMDTKEVIARFEAERQALAMMDHPNIAKVHDAGATDQGRPYFVMELVEGIPVTRFCDEQGFNTRQRLELFADVCSAINHAHQKGVIHRDIKPSNVMVTLHGDRPLVKVIDFGIAKATHGRLTDMTVFTRFEQFIGTPAYMSPEQTAFSGLDVDTRSDIYALGILLYELLTGKPPFDTRTLLAAGYEEMRRIIREVEPPKPSTRLKAVDADSRISLAKSRNIQPERLGRLVEPDLDWIVMKAIEKDRARRYETANGLALDIRRYLTDEPVSAGPPTAAYRFKKFARRNKVLLRVSAGIAAVLIAATIISMQQAVKARNAEREANAESAMNAQTAYVMRRILAGVSPEEAQGRDTTLLREILTRASDEVRTGLRGQPAVEAVVRHTIGSAYHSLGLYQEAKAHLEPAVEMLKGIYGPTHPRTLDASLSLAVLWFETGRTGEAFKLREDLLAASREVNGPEHRSTLGAMGGMAISLEHAGRLQEGLQLQEEVVALHRKVSGPEHSDTLSAMHNLALCYKKNGRTAPALKLKEEVLTLRRKVEGVNHPDTLRAMVSLSDSYRATGRETDALNLMEEAVPVSVKVNGMEHPDTLGHRQTIGILYLGVARYDEAIRVLREVLTTYGKLYGAEGRATLGAMQNLASAYEKAGKAEDAFTLREEALALYRKAVDPEPEDLITAIQNMSVSFQTARRYGEEAALLREALELNRQRYGLEHAHSVTLLTALATSLNNADRGEEAYKLFGEALDLSRRVHGSEHSSKVHSLINLAAACDATHRGEEAARLWEEAEALSRKVNGPEHPDTLKAMDNLAFSRNDAGREPEALTLRERVRDARLKNNGLEHTDTLRAMINLGASYFTAQRMDEARDLWENVLQRSPRVNGPEHSDTLTSMINLAKVYDHSSRKPEALKLREEALPICRRIKGKDHTETLGLMHNLAGSYVEAGRLPEALALLEPTLTLSRSIKGPDHPDTFKTMILLAGVYDASNRPEDHLRIWEEALPVCRKINGPDHRETIVSMHNLSVAYYNASREEDAVRLWEQSIPLSRTINGPDHPETRAMQDSLAVVFRRYPDLSANAGGADTVGKVPSNATVSKTLVPANSEWKWLHPTDGTDPLESVPGFHEEFYLPDFDDSKWNTGRDKEGVNGGFGYGINFSGVDIGTPKPALRYTAYFRHRFTTRKRHKHLELRCRRDDGIIVYLDGKEVLRDNMVPGDNAYRLSALEALGPDVETLPQRFRIPGELSPGVHLLAVSVHNATRTSSDLRLGGVTVVELEVPASSSTGRTRRSK